MPLRFHTWIMLIVLLLAFRSSADTVETRDGRKIEGPVHLADGHLFIRSTPPVKLRLDELATFTRDAASGGATDEGGSNGVLVEYFADMDWKESCAVLPAASASINWGGEAPNPHTPRDFSARITGFITAPRTGEYHFHVAADDFARCQIGSARFGGDWGGENKVQLEAGKRVPLTVEFRDTGSHAHVTLTWEGPGITRETMPDDAFSPPADAATRIEQWQRQQLAESGGGLKGEYFEEANFRQRKLIRVDSDLDIVWRGNSDVLAEMDKKEFWARWTGKLRPHKTGKAKISLGKDHKRPTRVWLDNKPIIDAWDDFEKARRDTEVELKAGQLYDLKVEYASGSGSVRGIELLWDLDERRSKPIPSSALIPPDDMPRVRILSPIDGQEMDGTDGVPVQVLVLPGKTSIKKVEIMPNGANHSMVDLTQPPFRAVIPATTVGDMNLVARITTSNGIVLRSPAVSFSVVSAPSEALGGEWSLARAGGAQAPQVQKNGDRLEVTGRDGAVGEKSKMPLVCQLLSGDGEIVAHLLEVRSEQPEAIPLAGVTLRRAARTDSPHLTLVGSRASGWIIGHPHGSGSNQYQEKPVPAPSWLKITRTGSIASAYWSPDGKDWTQAGSISIGDDKDLLIGLTAFSLNGNGSVTGVFEQVAVREGGSEQLASAAGLQLVSGTVMTGEVTISDSRISLKTPDEQTRTFARDQVARVFYGPVGSDVAGKLTPGWRGAVVAGDLLEGELADLSGDAVTINSLIFGIRSIKKGEGLDAVVLNDLTSPRAATEISHTRGRLVATDVRLDNDKLIARDPTLGELRLSINDVLRIRRP